MVITPPIIIKISPFNTSPLFINDSLHQLVHEDNVGKCFSFVPSSLLRTEGAGMMCQTAGKRGLAAMRSGRRPKNEALPAP